MRLVDRHPFLDATALASRFAPPHRFEDVRFETYMPDPAYPTQTEALARCQAFTRVTDGPRRRFWQRSHTPARPGLYLDGGFGVGKTHLLASLWHAHVGRKAYLTFTELTAFVGFAGMDAATSTFRDHALLCIDEFELDDVANTLMVVSFLRGALADGLRVAVTSNTLPDRLGEGRFSAVDFRREIAAIAQHFDDFRVDGPDFRTSHRPLPLVAHATSDVDSVSTDTFDELLPHLRRVHPVQYGAMFDGLGAVRIEGLHPITDQGDALMFVQFIDKLYDARIPMSLNGCDVAALFDTSYRNGGFRKKYGRAESRMTAMQEESTGVL
jgi:cell division protein ZapE